MIAPHRETTRAERDQLARSLTAPVSAGARTLLVELLARSLVDAYAESVQTGDTRQLIAWADRMCAAHADTPAVRTLFAEACGPLRAGSKLERSLRAVAAKPRNSLGPAPQTLDEVDAAINSLIVRLERADPLTAEHSRAVSAWCTRLARRLALSEAETVFVARSGMVHDVGKVATPVEILNAPRSLTPEEWAVIRNHTTAGERIVLADPSLAPFAPAVRSHHERLDGSGYPDGLAAADIALTTRIVAVADSFNAMIGRRPYRLPMSPNAALEQLAQHSGTQFDPDVVAAMRDIVR